jgi:hypothetical protein
MSMAVTSVAKAAGDFDSRRPDAAAYVQNVLAGLEASLADKLIGRRPAAGMNDALAQHGKEGVRIELVNLSGAERAGMVGDLGNAHRSCS